jgi:hypothetical protein
LVVCGLLLIAWFSLTGALAVVAHASELALLFGPIPPVAAIETEFSMQMRDFYINFVNDLNPGRTKLSSRQRY